MLGGIEGTSHASTSPYAPTAVDLRCGSQVSAPPDKQGNGGSLAGRSRSSTPEEVLGSLSSQRQQPRPASQVLGGIQPLVSLSRSTNGRQGMLVLGPGERARGREGRVEVVPQDDIMEVPVPKVMAGGSGAAEEGERTPQKGEASESRGDGCACAICFEDTPASRVGVLPCLHVFCFECIKEWAKAAATLVPECPLCKTPFHRITMKHKGKIRPHQLVQPQHHKETSGQGQQALGSIQGGAQVSTGVSTGRTEEGGGGSPTSEDQILELTPRDPATFRSSLAPSLDPVLEEVVCQACGGGHAEDQLLLCDTCETLGAHHTFCLDPPLADVPGADEPWYCPRCSQDRASLWRNLFNGAQGQEQRRGNRSSRRPRTRAMAQAEQPVPPSFSRPRRQAVTNLLSRAEAARQPRRGIDPEFAVNMLGNNGSWRSTRARSTQSFLGNVRSVTRQGMRR